MNTNVNKQDQPTLFIPPALFERTVTEAEREDLEKQVSAPEWDLSTNGTIAARDAHQWWEASDGTPKRSVLLLAGIAILGFGWWAIIAGARILVESGAELFITLFS